MIEEWYINYPILVAIISLILVFINKNFPALLGLIRKDFGFLAIETTPENAEKRFLNSKVKYSCGMKIRPGIHKVIISAEGYKTIKSNISINPKENVIKAYALESIEKTREVSALQVEKIAIDFNNTDIKNVIRIIQDISEKNFAIDPDVKGEITITIEKPVPWNQVLSAILRMHKLAAVKEGQIIRIATLDTLNSEKPFLDIYNNEKHLLKE